ncbi:MAG TPA: hypothetical protein VJV21_05690, partial [Pyrinomonadaceae bacterium]|nr:hypothetical protein [Pyrinomonadaceae bacterium]
MTLAGLADVLWSQKGQDDYARQLLLGLYDELLAERPRGAESKAGESPGSATVERLKRVVIRSIAHHDLKLAQKLISEGIPAGPEADARVNTRLLDTANELIRDGDASTAGDLASRALQTDLSHKMIETLLVFLHRLRAADEVAADALFTQVMERLARQLTISPEDLLIIGNYLFIDDRSVAPGNIQYTPSMVGTISFRAGISASRSGIPRPLVRTYLNTALHILSRPASDEAALLQSAAAARLLLPKAQEFAPDLVTALSTLSARFAATKVTDLRTARRDSQPIDMTTALAELEKLPAGEARDQKTLGWIETLFARPDLDSASKLTALLTDETARARISDLIRFRRLANLVVKPNVTNVEERIPEVREPELRVSLEIALASRMITNKDLRGANVIREKALAEVREKSFQNRGVYLTTLAGIFSRTDQSVALAL